jgi:uncharacterized protein
MIQDPLLWAPLVAAVLTGTIIQGTIGVGFALVVVPIAAWFNPSLLPGGVLLLMLPLNLFVLAREAARIDLKGFGWVSLGRVMGTFGGLWLLSIANARQLGIIVGVSILAAVAASLARPDLTPGRRTFWGAGLATGITETATGIGGPPLALAYQHRPAQIIRPTLALCFLLSQLFSLAALLTAGRMSPIDLVAPAALLPVLAIGLFVSRYGRDWLDDFWLRKALLAFALVSGAVLILA